MSWIGPGFVDCHSHLIAVAAGETELLDPTSVASYHRQLQARGSSPMDVPHVPQVPDLDSAIEQVLFGARQLGIVEFHEAGLGNWEHLDALTRLCEQDRLPIRVRVFLRSGVADVSKMRRFGAERLEILGVKFYADGWIGPRTCALAHPFSDQPENAGVLFADADTLVRRITPFANAGWQIATHAIGDRAIQEVVDAYERIYGSDCAAQRPRIEHAQVTTPELVARIAELGIVCCIQPSFAVSDATSAKAALGARFATAYDWPAMLAAGVKIITGSDYPIETQDPLTGLQHLVTGAAVGGEPAAGAKPLDLTTALQLMTDPAAGTVTLSADPATVPNDSLHQLQVLSASPL